MLLLSIAEAALPKLHTWRPQELANTGWAYARLLLLHERFMEAIAERLLVLRRGSLLEICSHQGAA
ncbi:unnamed protein product [Symbiodinium pilosum]|uniref:Uncharacterized protein n=1 Tax=Symbiodinium pilosum TaxID=2952 RepID=A0A812PV11_SYMPI|nr:unnamed protein product [Symbiodinium pilosum]